MAREAVNIVSQRINEAIEFRKLFSRDKNPELRNLGCISYRIKVMLKIKRG
jgi:hypothetical protein